MKITCLVENTLYTEAGGCGCEHGLSLHIETGGTTILFDMGQTELFAENAERLGIDLAKVDIAVLEINDHAPVYLSRYAFEAHYNGSGKYIGLDPALEGNPRLIPVDEQGIVGEGMALFSANDRPRPHSPGTFGLTMLEDGVHVPDDFRHEQYLLIEENGRKILFSGCSHKGILDIVRWFTPDILIGGFHFSKITDSERLTDYARDLNAFDTVYYTCHCTGEEVFRQMKPHMPRLFYLAAGRQIEV